MGLVVIVWVLRSLHAVSNQLLQSRLLADEFNEFWNTATTAEDDQFLLLKKELLDRATLLLIQELVDLHVASISNNIIVNLYG